MQGTGNNALIKRFNPSVGYNVGGIDLWKLSLDGHFTAVFESTGNWNNIPLRYNGSQLLSWGQL